MNAPIIEVNPSSGIIVEGSNKEICGDISLLEVEYNA
jgi:hypothetical protein